jgi:hypothetical protein
MLQEHIASMFRVEEKVEGSSQVFVTAHKATPPHIQQDLIIARTSNLREEYVYKKTAQGVLTQHGKSPERDSTIYHVLTATFFI